MSLAIDIDLVTDVLLADGWHHVENDSFEIDAYEFLQTWFNEVEKSQSRLLGGQEALVPSRGFFFSELHGGEDVATYGPITSIIALRARQRTEAEERERKK
ncbi:MAG TPA: hypothetical protein VGX91_07615 [Candidatus Cybelea sp.]|jgi:hypothetical protein|nr:hypothetical protein [Candidatus Cybelea sp.]